jgi:Fe-S cluster assembly scaffold protein SufB
VVDVIQCHAHAQLIYLLDSHEIPQTLRVMHQLNLNLASYSLAQIFLGLLHFTLHSFTLKAELQGCKTQLHLKGISYLAQAACNHRVLNVNHRCSQSTSTLQLLACTTEKACFIGRASSVNAKDLHTLDLQQQFKGILLSDTSTISFVPSLSINAGEVKATHSVAIYTLHRQHLWYLQTRGLSYPHIRHTVVMNILTGGFFSFQEQLVEVALLQKLVSLL